MMNVVGAGEWLEVLVPAPCFSYLIRLILKFFSC